MRQIILAKRYARAIFALGTEKGVADTYAETLSALADIFENPDFGVVDAVSNPLYPLEVRQNVMTKIAKAAGADALMTTFLNLLVERKRVDVMCEIAGQVQEMLDRRDNISHGSVTSATELDQELLAKVQATLENITGNKVILETQVDPSIIGGIVAKVGDLVLDGSIRTQLNGLKQSIKGRG